MSYINWMKEVFINPVTLSASASPPGIPIPTYGNYGGPDYSDGSVGGAIPPSGALLPVDKLDALFYAHDLAYQQNPSATEISSADLTLIHGIEILTATRQLDAEASLYAGATILGIASFMAANGNPLSLRELIVADATAAYDIKYGLSHLSSTERGQAEAALQNIVWSFAHPAVQVAGTFVPAFSGSLSQLVQASAVFAAGAGGISSSIGPHPNDVPNPAVLATNFMHHHG
jgi:hypothetical protein